MEKLNRIWWSICKNKISTIKYSRYTFDNDGGIKFQNDFYQRGDNNNDDEMNLFGKKNNTKRSIRNKKQIQKDKKQKKTEKTEKKGREGKNQHKYVQ